MEKRGQVRAFLDGACMARLLLGARQYGECRVLNLGVDGCCLELAEAPAGTPEFELEPCLADLVLLHPDLPACPVPARIVWQRQEQAGERSATRCGVKFLDPPEGYARQLGRAVDGMIRTHLRGNDWILSRRSH